MTETFLSALQTQANAFHNVVGDDVLRLRDESGEWQFGAETISLAAQYFLQSPTASGVEIGLVNQPGLNATWYPNPDTKDAYVIGVNVGLVETLKVIAFDVFGHGEETDNDSLGLKFYDKEAAKRVSERVGAFLEIGFPLGNAIKPSPKRAPFVRALVDDAMQFLVLHEFAHIMLGHVREDVHVLRNQMSDLQIATFSIGQEHQADRLAARLHASMRRTSTQKFPGMEFGGPTLLLSVLGVFERYGRYEAFFDTPHAHPRAYERLYRLRVRFDTGDGHMYWSIPGGEGPRLARLDLDAHPDAVRFSDAIADTLLRVLEEVEASEKLPSPFLDIFNRLCSGELSEGVKNEFWREISRWLFLGSPAKVLQHLGEANLFAAASLKDSLSDDDRTFYLRSVGLIENVIPKIENIQDHCVREAVRLFKDLLARSEVDT